MEICEGLFYVCYIIFSVIVEFNRVGDVFKFRKNKFFPRVENIVRDIELFC